MDKTVSKANAVKKFCVRIISYFSRLNRFLKEQFFIFTLSLMFALIGPAYGANILPETQSVFGKFSDRVLKIQVVESGSGAKSEIGSGFFVSKNGHLATNYHVISKLVLHPDRYRAELVENSGTCHPLTVLGVDVINDIAIVKSELNSTHFFSLAPIKLKQGTRLYAFGYPLDIGISIVEGTYNGLLEHALYKKIHFTGSLNPGMSGGPTITATGAVAGINVATEGNEVSFLVPVEAAEKLFSSISSGVRPKNLLATIRSQLLSHQNVYFTDNLIKSGNTVRLGNYQLPSKPAPFFKCWGDADHSEKNPYYIINHQCSTDDYVYISGKQESGIIQFHHRLISSDELNLFRFFNLYSAFFKRTDADIYGNEEEVTRYQCKTDTVRHNQIAFKTAFCIRKYRKLEGLYDIVFKAAVLGSDRTGLETTLVISGVSFEKAVSLSQSYLEAISWAK